MEINVGEYVRTKNGIIEQLTSKTMLYNHYGHFFTRSDRDECYAKEEIIKHSKDITDLAEIGDFITYKIKNLYIEYPCRVSAEYNEDIGETELIVNGDYLKDVEITSILTHEQFEDNAYKIEKER